MTYHIHVVTFTRTGGGYIAMVSVNLNDKPSIFRENIHRDTMHDARAVGRSLAASLEGLIKAMGHKAEIHISYHKDKVMG